MIKYVRTRFFLSLSLSPSRSIAVPDREYMYTVTQAAWNTPTGLASETAMGNIHAWCYRGNVLMTSQLRRQYNIAVAIYLGAVAF